MSSDTVPMLVYLLCDLARKSKSRHYVGSARPDMIFRRLQDHRAGNGCLSTRIMLRQGAVLHLAAIWPADDRQLEHETRRGGHLENMCPVCREEIKCGQPPAYEPQPPNNTVPLSWSPLVF